MATKYLQFGNGWCNRAIMGRPVSKFPRITFRLPEDLKESLEKAAAENGQGVSAEIVARLDQSFIYEEHDRKTADEKLREELTELRYGMILLLETFAARDEGGMKKALEEVFEKHRNQVDRIRGDGKQYFAQFAARRDDPEPA